MKKIAIFLFAIAVGGMVCGQEQVLSLRQIVDSVLSNRAKFIPLQFRQSEEMNGNLWRPLEISYRKGYLYSTQVEQEWRIQQEVENPIRWFDRGKLKKNEALSLAADSALQVKQLIAAVKKAYFLCVYRYAVYNHYRRVIEMVERMMSGLPADSMEERLNSLYSEWWVKQQDSYFDWLDAQNELRYQAGFEEMGVEGLQHGMTPAHLKRIRELEKENKMLKQLLAEKDMECKMQEDLLKKRYAPGKRRL